ncbi:MAG: alpha/beta fold hydrolase [Niveispirillum sp.]|nr:alpha/beta fold hydrolase [Niveispirillum sp.]
MTRPLFLFVHGWAGTPRLWDPVRAALTARGVEAGDMVTDVPSAGAARPLIAIGHSLGAAWLLAHGPALSGFVAINGFTRFTSAPDFPAGTHPRILMQMRRRLLADPSAVLADFHARAGLPLPDGLPDTDTLAAGLDLLGSIDARAAFAALSVPHTALCGGDDLIVPPEQSRGSFPDPVMVPSAGHALPVTHPDLCADHILSLVARC